MDRAEIANMTTTILFPLRSMRGFAAASSLALSLAGCGGGGAPAAEPARATEAKSAGLMSALSGEGAVVAGTPTSSSALILEPTAAPAPAPLVGAAADECTLPPAPSMPANAVDVRNFGARPDDKRDDTKAIQAALDSLAPGQWLVFPPGTYRHNARLTMRRPGTVMWGEGATLHATNPRDQAVMLAADGVGIYNFTMTAVTDVRLSAPWQARIAVFDRVERVAPLRDVVIRGNHIVNAGAPGTATANGAASAGIFVYRADGFLVAENEVRRTLSDGIHITAGSRNGRVLYNTVRETGDDMIAMVSYLSTGDWVNEDPARLAATFAAARDQQLVRNVLVAHNDVAGQYWGRGISVVGGADITIRANRIARTTVGAGVLVAREASYTTWGARNVRVEDNAISQVQTQAPAYTPTGWTQSAFRTGHAGIEIHAFVFDEERKYPDLLAALSVEDVRVAGNTITDTGANGIRVGEGTGATGLMTGTDALGNPVSRAYGGGVVGRIDLSASSMSRTAAKALSIKSRPTAQENVYCEALISSGVALTDPNCFGLRPAVTGAALSCQP